MMALSQDYLAPAGADAARSEIATFSDVRFAWPGRTSFALAIDRFAIARGKRLLLIGPSGSGKSTFLSLLAGIVAPDAGLIEILQTDIAALRPAARDRFRAEHFGIIFQMFNLLPYGSILDNVMLPLRFSSTRRQRVEAEGRPIDVARRLLGALGLDGDLIARAQPTELSVGQQQRVAAARALIGRPEIIVADEPTSALDRNLQMAFLDLLFAEIAAAGSSLVMVSHDESLAPKFDAVQRLDEIAVATREASQ